MNIKNHDLNYRAMEIIMTKFKIFFLVALLISLLGFTVGAGNKTSVNIMSEGGRPVKPSPHKQTKEDDWEYTSFKEEGLDPTRFEFLKACIHDGTFRKVDSVVVVKRGKILIEEYFNGYDRDKLHEIRSATKSIGSALMGIAIDQGYFAGVRDKLFVFFPELKPFQNWDMRKNDITLEHVLNMTTGLDCNDMDDKSAGNESNVLRAADIVKFMLDLPMAYDPGKHWAYSTGCAHLIGALIESRTSLSVQEFAKANLFEPLNISQYQWEISGGIAHTGGGFWMRPIDMAKFGQLYLNRGRWQRQPIISEIWIDESTRIHTKVTNDLGYGYLWWKWVFNIDGRPFFAFSAQGNGENHIFVFPELELVVVITGSAYEEIYGPAQTSMMMNKYILPAVVQDIDPHNNKPHLRTVPDVLFALCIVILVSAFIIWPLGFIMRKIRGRQMKDSGSRRPYISSFFVRLLSAISAFITIVFLAAFLAEILTFNLLLNSGMSHPLGIFEVFLGTNVLTMISLIVWIIVLLAMAQAVFMILAHRNKWWTGWQRWHYTAITLAECYFVIVLLWWGFGKVPF